MRHVDKDPLVAEMQSVCCKPVEFIDEVPTLESILDNCRMKFALPKYDKMWDEMDETEQFNYLHKYTQILTNVINIDEKIYLIGDHGNTVWNERGVDTCIPWYPNMPCPFNTYSKDGSTRKITSCRMPKESYEDKASLIAHWYLFYTITIPIRLNWCQLLRTDAYGEKLQCEGSESKDSDYLKDFKHHGFDYTKACNYMSIYKIGAINRVNIKLQYPEFTHTKTRKNTKYTLKYWIWLNVDKEDPRGPITKTHPQAVHYKLGVLC